MLNHLQTESDSETDKDRATVTSPVGLWTSVVELFVFGCFWSQNWPYLDKRENHDEAKGIGVIEISLG